MEFGLADCASIFNIVKSVNGDAVFSVVLSFTVSRYGLASN